MSSDEAQSTASGQGVRGAGKGENADNVPGPDKGTSETQEGNSQGAAGEGQTADAVKGGSGIGGNKHTAGA